MGNGLDNAHNNAFGNGNNPGIGGVSGYGGTSSGGSGGSNKPGPSGVFTGWCTWGTPSKAGNLVGPDGSPIIEITQGMQRCQIKVDIGSSGNNNSAGISSQGRFKPVGSWNPNPDDWNVIENGQTTVPKGTFDLYTVRVNTHLYGMTMPDTGTWLINPGDGDNGKTSSYKSFEYYKGDAYKTLTDYLDVKDSISRAAAFYKEIGNKYGDAFAKQSEKYADAAKGKKIRNANEAIAAFNRYKDVLNKKFSVADRNAIANALESLNKEQMAKTMKTFGKAFGLVGTVIDFNDLRIGLTKGFRTGDWGDAFRQGEKMASTQLASALVAFTFAAMTASPIGIVGYAIVMAVTSALIDTKLMNEINEFVLSL